MKSPATLPPQAAPSDRSGGAAGLRQRRCDCGRPIGPSGECADCRRKRLGVQPKLRVSRPGDRAEREADRIAEQVTQGASALPSVTSVGAVALQRKCAACEHEERLLQPKEAGAGSPIPQEVPAEVAALPGGGRPLDAGTRAELEPRFGHDFSRVRLYDGAAGEAATRAVGARAFTVGHRVAFGRGEYSPRSAAGRQLLAHELTHVVQQGAARPLAGGGALLIERVDAGPQLQRAIRAGCLAHMAQNKGTTPVCNPPPAASSVGSRVGAAIERQFRSESPDHVTQLPIPAAPKSAVHGTAPLDPSSVTVRGFVDVAKIVSRGANTVRLQIGEVKPMNAQVAAGALELEYYKAKIEQAEDDCVRLKEDFLDPLEERLKALPPDQAKRKRKEALKEGTRLLAQATFCKKLGAVGKKVTLAKQYGLTWRSHTFDMVLGGKKRKILAMTCADGVIGYRCLEKPEKKKDKKKEKKKGNEKSKGDKGKKAQPKKARPKSPTGKSPAPTPRSQKAAERQARRAEKAAERQARRAARAAEKEAERQLRKKLVEKGARKAIVKTVGKVAARLALRAVPVVGWVLLAIDIAEAAYGIYNIAKYGVGSGGDGGPPGEGGKQGEGAPGGAQSEGATEGGVGEGVEGGTEREGTTEGGAHEGGEGTTEGGEGTTEGEGGETTGEKGSEGEKGGEGGAKPGGKEGGSGAQDLDEDLKRLGIFDSEADAEAYAESLPLNAELIEALKRSTPEQQQLLQRVLGDTGEASVPVTEEFFKTILDITSAMTAEELATLEAHLVPVQPGESLDAILERYRAALKAIREGKPLGEAGDESEGGDASKEGKGSTGGGEGTGKEKKKAGEGGGEGGTKGAEKGPGEGGAAEGEKKKQEGEAEPPAGTAHAQTPPPGVNATPEGSFPYRIVSGMEPGGSYTAGESYSCTVEITHGGRKFIVAGVRITFKGRTDKSESIKGTSFTTTRFELYFTENFWVEEYKFLGLGGPETASTYDFGRRRKK